MILLLGFAFLAGIVTILSPCILPILPIVLSGSVGRGKRKPLGIILGFIFSFTLLTLSYALGSGIPMFLIMIGGRGLLNKAPNLLANTEKIQKGFGIIMVLFAIGIFFHLDTNFEAFIASSKYGLNLTNLENNQAVKNQLNSIKGNTATNTNNIDTSGLLNTNTPAPDFVGI